MKASLLWIFLGGLLFLFLGITSFVVSSATGSPTACVAPPAGLVSWWKAEDNAQDSADNNHGTVYSAQYANGTVGRAFSFDGNAAYVGVSDAPNLDGYSAFSVEAWIRPDTLGWPNPDPDSDYEAAIISKYDSSEDSRRSYVFALTDGQLKLTVFGGANLQRAIANTPVPIGSWSHVAGVWNGNTIELYVNGSPVTSSITGSSPSQLNNSVTPLNIGRVESYSGTHTGPAAFFDGLIDEASLYNRALTSSEISAIAAAADGKCDDTGAPTPTPEPYTHLPFFALFATPTPTVTPTATPSGPIIANGGFEQGHTAWTEFSSHGYDIILHENDLPVSAHNGSWATWFGGEFDEASIIEQVITIPHDRFILTYWLWIASQDICNPEYDIAGVLVNDEAVDAYILCDDNSTGGWIARSVNLSAYAGQRVTLTFAAFTDNVLNSNLFIDDVAMQTNALQPLPLAAGDGTTLHLRKPPALAGAQAGGLAPLSYRDALRAYLSAAQSDRN